MASKQGDRRPVYRASREDWLWGNRVFWTAILMAIAAVLSAIKPVVLSDGGAVTSCSLLFLWLITFFYGPRYGVLAGVLFGAIKFFITFATGEFINYEIGAVILEYPVACGAVALGGLVLNRIGVSRGRGGIVRDGFGLRFGYLIGVVAMGVCYVVSAILYYPPDREGFWANLLFATAYDMSYLLVEAAITLLLLCVPIVTDAIYYLRHVATSKRRDPTLTSF